MFVDGLNPPEAPPFVHEDVARYGQDLPGQPTRQVETGDGFVKGKGEKDHHDDEEDADHAMEVIGRPNEAASQKPGARRFDEVNAAGLDDTVDAMNHAKSNGRPKAHQQDGYVGRLDPARSAGQPHQQAR